MLSGTEKIILDWLVKKNLMKKREIQALCKQQFGQHAEDSLAKLRQEGLIESLEPVGETCFVITKKGIRTLKGE